MSNNKPKNILAWGIYDEKGQLVCVSLNREQARSMREEGEKIVRVHIKPLPQKV